MSEHTHKPTDDPADAVDTNEPALLVGSEAAAHVGETPDPKSGATLWVALIGTLLLLVVVLFAQYLYLHVQWIEDQDKVYARAPREIFDLRARQSEVLYQPQMLDLDTGRARVPIRQALVTYAREMRDHPGPRPAPTIEPAGQPEQPESTEPPGPQPEPAESPAPEENEPSATD